MLKESKITVLENFYGIDYVLFGKDLARVETCCPLLKEDYLSIKGAMLSVYIEMLKLMNHEPTKLNEFIDTSSLKSRARHSARIAREYAERLVKSTKSRNNIKESLKETLEENPNVNVSTLVEDTIRQKAWSIAIDSLLVAKALNEAVEVSNMNTWEGSLLEDSYKILRDNLIEAAWQIMESEEDVDEDYLDEVHATSGEKLATGAALAGGYGAAIAQAFGACARKCGRLSLSSERAACKAACNAKRDAKIKKARAKMKEEKAKAKEKFKATKRSAKETVRSAKDKAHQARTSGWWDREKAKKRAKLKYKSQRFDEQEMLDNDEFFQEHNEVMMEFDEFLNEVHMTQYQKDVVFGRINRLFGQCAQKCGRIALSQEKRACKKACQKTRDEQIRKARADLKHKKKLAKYAGQSKKMDATDAGARARIDYETAKAKKKAKDAYKRTKIRG